MANVILQKTFVHIWNLKASKDDLEWIMMQALRLTIIMSLCSDGTFPNNAETFQGGAWGELHAQEGGAGVGGGGG